MAERPVITNRAGNPVTFSDAERAWARAFSSMWTHAGRALHLAEAHPRHEKSSWDSGTWNPREHCLEECDRRLAEVEDWCRMMRDDLDELLDAEGIRERVAKLRAKAESTTFPAEAETFHAKADEIERRVED